MRTIPALGMDYVRLKLAQADALPLHPGAADAREKVCSRCGHSKPLREFYRNSGHGRKAECAECYNARRRTTA